MRDEVIQLVADFMLQKGVDVHVKGRKYNWDCQVLHLAAFYNKPDLIRLLVAMGADVNDSFGNSGTPLFWSAVHGRYEATKTLIECGADVNATNWSGMSVLRQVVLYDKQKVAKLLREHGAKE